MTLARLIFIAVIAACGVPAAAAEPMSIEEFRNELVGALLAIMGVAILAEQGKGSAFIYFQF